jgi:hypothetical protein
VSAARAAQLNTGRFSLASALHVGDPVTPDDDDATDTGAEAEAEAEVAGRAEGVWSERTKGVLGYLQGRFAEQRPRVGSPRPQLGAYALLAGQTSREAARFFFECLLLNNKGFVTLAQERPFAEITVTSTGKKSLR